MYIILALIALSLVIYFGWRIASRKASLPCPVWLRWMVEYDNPFTKTNRSAVIIAQFDLHPGMSVLDAGCGPGRLTIPLAKAVGAEGQVVALDIQSGMLDRVREKAQAENLKNIHFLQAGLGEGKLERNQFDRALLVTVLGEIPDREAALKEIFEALKPGGILSVTELIFDPHFQGRRTVERLTGEAGFRASAFFGNRFAYTAHFEKPGNN